MQCDFIKVGDTEYPVQVFFEKRKNSRVSIGKRAVYIRIPSQLSDSAKELQIRKFGMWVEETLRRAPPQLRKSVMRRYRDGDSLTVGKKTYRLAIELKDKKTSSARCIGSTIHLSLSSRTTISQRSRLTATLLSRCIAGEHLQELKKRIVELNDRHIRKTINTVRFKYNKSNWGSCSAKGNINISTRLLFAPDSVLEYVCIHELAHLAVKNHSKRFWNLVAHAMPDYRVKVTWLKENGHTCDF